MKKWVQENKIHWKDRNFVASTIFSFVFLIISLVINFYAGTYATEKASSPVTDIILSNIRVFDVGGIFVYGSILFWTFIAIICFYRPQKIPFTVKSIALFVIIRSIFVSLTHIGPFISEPIFESMSIISKFTFGGDLFFSGHTGLPFLMALVFWEDKILRSMFVATSLLFGVVVLLAHLHYSIDVLAAFFITYSIYHIALFLFKKDHRIFQSNHTDSIVLK